MSASVPAGRTFGALRIRTELRGAGALGGLGAVVLGSLWVAVGAAGELPLLELPYGSPGHWVSGPFRPLGVALGGLPDGALSAALLLICGGYLLALLCAPAISARRMLTGVALAVMAFTLAPSLVSTDAFGYLAYAREAVRHGLNPYLSAPLSLHGDAVLQLVYWRHQPSPYGPLFTLLSAPLGLLPVPLAFWLLKVVTGGATVLLVALVGRVASARGMCAGRAMALVGLNPLLLVYALSGAHNDLLAALLLVLGLATAAQGRSAAAGAAVLAAAGIKLTFGLALPFLWFGAPDRRRALRGTALAAALLGAVTLVLFGLHPVDQLRRIATDPLFDVSWSGPDLLSRLLGSSIDSLVRILCTAGAALVALVMLGRAWRGADPVAAAGWAFLALIASISSLAPWYLVWLLPLAALARDRALPSVAVLVTLGVLAIHLPAGGGHLWLSAPSGDVPRSVAQLPLGRPAPLRVGAPGGRIAAPGELPHPGVAPWAIVLG